MGSVQGFADWMHDGHGWCHPLSWDHLQLHALVLSTCAGACPTDFELRCVLNPDRSNHAPRDHEICIILVFHRRSDRNRHDFLDPHQLRSTLVQSQTLN